MPVEFHERVDLPGLEIRDTGEQRRVTIRTPEEISMTASDTDGFCFPVDESFLIESDRLIFDHLYSVSIHDADGQSVDTLAAGESVNLNGSTSYIGLSGPMKIYCGVESGCKVETGIDSVHITLDESDPINIGARSFHETPAGTITTTDDFASMARAVSRLSSSLKTTSPERSWPSMRGHPPLIQIGDKFDIPDTIPKVEEGVSIEIPPDFLQLYIVSPLAFYLGADIRLGSVPRILTSDGEYELERPGISMEDLVARRLKQIFFLDCIVRTEGFIRFDLEERNQLESKFPFDIPKAYDLSTSERLAAYFSVPFETIEDHLPRWSLTAHLPPDPRSIESIPFVVNELGIVREPSGSIEQVTAKMTTSTERSPVRPPADVRSAAIRESSSLPSEFTFIEPDVTNESIEHAWFGDHTPKKASKATVKAYQNQLNRLARTDSIDILLVCNEADMIDEHDALDGAYGEREDLPFDVDSEFGVSMNRLESLICDGGYDYLHYVGHATADGLQCYDGDLDIRTISNVDIGVFFLNACHSYDQGMAFIEAGAFGGIVTLGDIVNDQAIEVGETVGRLLNLGFPLRATLEVTKEMTLLGDQYLIVGDGSTDIAQSDGGNPTVLRIETTGESTIVAANTYSTKEFQMGTAGVQNFSDSKERHLLPGEYTLDDIDQSDLEAYLTWTKGPIVKDNSIIWSDSAQPMKF